MDVQVGIDGVVGLKYRNRDLTSQATRLEVITDGQSRHHISDLIFVFCTDSDTVRLTFRSQKPTPA